MSTPDIGSTARGSVKTLAIRLEPDTHAQLTLIAQLRGNTITDEIRAAIEAHITSAKSAPELAAQAGNALEEIEREALARRAAITSLFGADHTGETAEPATEPPARRRGRKSTGETEAPTG